MKKIFALLLAILVVSSFSITAFAAPVDEATIDTSRTGTLDIYKYDLTNAEKDGVWDSSYVSTGVKDENGVEAVLEIPLSQEEHRALMASADRLKAALASL